MFEVKCVSPIDDCWQMRDREILDSAAIVNADRQISESSVGKRQHIFEVTTIKRAVRLKDLLNAIPDVTATLKEQ